MQDAMRAPSLFRTYRHHFSIGAAVTLRQLENADDAAMICRHFSSITAENIMKPERIMDREGTLAIGDGIHTAQYYEQTDRMLTFARDHGIRVRFHVLCWHNQTPFWFFTEDWQEVPFEKLRAGTADIPWASREVMLQRQEAYIRDVMTHVNTCFPGVVYAWDVVNEAIDPDQGAEGCYRTRSPWYQAVGPDFIPAAFRAARKYQAPGQLLFYNDYNCYEPVKLNAILDLLTLLKRERLVDGMGMQAHLMMDFPSIDLCEKAARAYAALGLTLHSTELDIHCPGDDAASQQALAEKYAAYFDMLVRLKNEGADVGCATFWGVTDRDSWLPGFRRMPSFPLLFTGERQTKPAFDAVTAVPDRYAVIRLNQLGYAEGLPVRIAVLSEEETVLRSAAGEVLRTVVPQLKPDEASRDRVALIDFDPLPAGAYTVTCGPVTRSFTVAAQPWRGVTNALIKGLYYQRCGTALLPEHAGVYAHPACHTGPKRLWEQQERCVCAAGGWHDAGDYGRYVTPGAVAAGHLLYAHLLFPQGCGDALNIPGSGNGVPDILNEARWELEWILRMQREDGAVWHKLTKDHFAPFIMPQDDTDQEYITPVSSLAAADTAAVCALASRVYRPYDTAFAERLLDAARSAWGWLEQHPDLVFANPDGIHTGQYGDRSDRDERFWAACELYAATGEEAFRTAAEALYREGRSIGQFGWADVSGMGALCCLFVLGEQAGPVLYTQLRDDIIAHADEVLRVTAASGYGTALRPYHYGWGSILPVMSNAISLIAAHLLTGRADLRDAALGQVHYALGLNALDTSFITGFGARRPMYPHHRPSVADGIAEPVPGLISGGPNGYMPYGETKKILTESTAPAKAWLDETPSADTNEIAIYWNTPAVLVFAFFNAMQ